MTTTDYVLPVVVMVELSCLQWRSQEIFPGEQIQGVQGRSPCGGLVAKPPDADNFAMKKCHGLLLLQLGPGLHATVTVRQSTVPLAAH